MSIMLDDILGTRLAGYEPREGQQRMADAVRGALCRSGQLVVEAGTGTGKSFAYLIPLAEFCMAEQRRAVVSTYTKALQRQLVEKDLPFIRDSVFGELRFALCLGSENYLCLRRLLQARTYGLFDGDETEIERLTRWAAQTESGVRDGIGPELWGRVSRESDLCFGRNCTHFGRCFYQRAKELERRSHILVVNHHLFFANLSSGLRALPEFSAAVFDEAHELEDVAAGYLGHEVSNLRVRHLLNSILGKKGRGLLARMKWLEQSDLTHLSSVVDSARMGADLFFSELSMLVEGQTLRLRERHRIDDGLSEGLLVLYRELDALRGASRDEDEKRELSALAARCESAALSLRTILAREIEGHVFWAARSGRALSLYATPVDVAGLEVFQDLETSVFTSATLSTGGSFEYIKGRLGLQGADELLIGPHFDYREQAALYIARDLPEPGSEEFEPRAIERIGEILRLTGGRTLVLFTSHGMLNRACRSVDAPGVRILRQGEADSYRLIEEFRKDGDSAIFGTNTFWQGVDVPGDALKCVVIVKLPFAVPDDPVTEARAEMLRRTGRDPFVHYQVPQAALLLKQGFGRLIRSASDRGAVAILDARIASRWYGKFFLRSLPECKITGDLEEIAGHVSCGRPNGRGALK